MSVIQSIHETHIRILTIDNPPVNALDQQTWASLSETVDDAMASDDIRVIVITGINKIVNDLDDALQRIHSIAAPMNARRHLKEHHQTELGELPCVRTGKCVDCNHDWRICRYTAVIEGCMIGQKNRINVVLVGEDLGF